MASAYSQDLRERVIRAIEGGASCRAAAVSFRREHLNGGELAAPLARHGDRCGKTDGRSDEHPNQGCGRRLAAGARSNAERSDLARDAGPVACGAGSERGDRLDLALSESKPDHT